MKRILAVVACLAFFCLGAGAALADTKVKVGLLRLTSSAPVFVAQEKGYFKKEGLDIEMVFSKAAQPIVVAMASGEVDVGATGLTAGLFNAMAEGLKAKIVADKGREWPGFHLVGIVVSNAAWEQGIRTLKDLKGHRVGVTQIGSTFHYMLGNLLPQVGLTLEDVKVTPLGGLKTLRDAVASNQIEAAFVVQPFCTVMEERKMGRRILWAGDWMRYQIAGIFFNESLLKNRQTALKFLRAYIAGCRTYFDSCLGVKDGKHVPGPGCDEVIAAVAKYTGEPPHMIGAALSYNDRDARLDVEDVQRQIDWYHQNRLLDRRLEASQIVDLFLWEEALAGVKP